MAKPVTEPLVVIPTYSRTAADVGLLDATLRTARETQDDAIKILVVDDGSPDADIRKALSNACTKYAAEFVEKGRNEGYSKTVNVGLRKALLEGRDAITVNADIEFGLTERWVQLMQQQTGQDGEAPAAIVGALLLYPNHTIQHAGIFFSFLTRDFGHRYHFGPGTLAEAQEAAICPVTGALQFIRHSTLDAVGLYDESFKLGWEDVDYCVRAWLAKLDCVYQPGVRAIHHESAFRGQGRQDGRIKEWTEYSWRRFVGKYAEVSFAEFVPNMLGFG
jgi:GT2 family glycosyltransferase